MGSNKLTISLIMPVDLLAQVDVLAKQNFVTRSDILRQAALAYIRSSDLDDKETKRLAPNYDGRRPRPRIKPKQEPKRDYDKIVKKLSKEHPYAHLYDKELLAFLDDYDNNRL